MSKHPRTELEAPPLPARPMTSTPKKRADLARVTAALRENRDAERGEDDEQDGSVPEEDPAEAAALDAEAEAAAQNPSPGAPAPPRTDPYDAQGFGAPEWFRMPPGGLPQDVEPGSVVGFMRFPVWVTGASQKGERQCALRPLSLALERHARQTTKGDKTGYETTASLAKMMICVVDGALPELFRGGPGSVNHFWAEIGPRARQAVITYYLQTHQFTEKQRDAFLRDCLAVRTVG